MASDEICFFDHSCQKLGEKFIIRFKKYILLDSGKIIDSNIFYGSYRDRNNCCKGTQLCYGIGMYLWLYIHYGIPTISHCPLQYIRIVLQFVFLPFKAQRNFTTPYLVTE